MSIKEYLLFSIIGVSAEGAAINWTGIAALGIVFAAGFITGYLI